jgi:DNA-binding beta-propeller fold protein YncE
MINKTLYHVILTALVTASFVVSTFVSSSALSSLHNTAGTNVQQTYVFVRQWGSHGIGNGQFQRVHDVEVDPSEKYLYTTDRDGNRVQVFDKNGTFLFKLGSKGLGDGQFNVPYSAYVDSKGDVWISDRGNHRIQEFDSKGNFLFKFGNTDGHPSSAPGKFDNPRQVAVDKEVKFLYVVDSKNNRIEKFYTNGTFVKSWGSKGTGDGQFDLPISLVIDSKGNIIVNDLGNSHIQKFDTNGKFIMKFGSTGTGDGQFSQMEHIALDKFDNIYVNDPQSGPSGSGNPRVQKFDSNGHFITKWGSYGSGDGQFVDPEHLAIDSDGFVYVTDRHNNNIQVFAPVNMTITGNRTTNNFTLPEELPPNLVNGSVKGKI